jgi:hypothetical protein
VTAQGVTDALYHSLIAAGHPSWCPALDSADAPCRCGRSVALANYEAWREGSGSAVLSLVLSDGPG